MDKRRSPQLAKWPFLLAYGLLFILSLSVYLTADPLTPLIAAISVFGLIFAGVLLVSPFVLEYSIKTKESADRFREVAEDQFDVIRNQVDELLEMRKHALKHLNTESENLKRFEMLESRYRDRLEELARVGGQDEGQVDLAEWRENLELTLEKLKGQMEGLSEAFSTFQQPTSEADNTAVLDELKQLKEAISLMSDRVDELSEEVLNPVSYLEEEEGEDELEDEEEPEEEIKEQESKPAPVQETARAPSKKTRDNGQAGLWGEFADPSATVEEEESPFSGTPKYRELEDDASVAIVARVNIGLGNTPYLRGEGPGLSWDKGVPMKFVEIGKWEWRAENADVPVVCRILKNDKEAATGEFIEVGVGQEVEVYPRFKE